jgi:hypothetical protein
MLQTHQYIIITKEKRKRKKKETASDHLTMQVYVIQCSLGKAKTSYIIFLPGQKEKMSQVS